MATETKKKGDVDWASIDTEITFEGKKIVLPGDPAEMEVDDAVIALQRYKDQQSQKFDVFEIVKGAPWDALTAIYKACQNIYGVVTVHSIKTWFGDILPDFVTINTGPAATDKIQVPMGQMRVPGFKEPFMIGFASASGAYIKGMVNKSDRTRLVEIANEARRIIRSDSIYRGKALSLQVDENGDLVLSEQPEFLDLSSVSVEDMIHTRETEQLIRTNVFSPLKNTAACRKHKIPLKRGILLEGRYGTGKSLTARVTAKVAQDSGWTFLMLSRSAGLKAAIEFAKSYQPCVIFAEDIDRAADRSNESVNDLVNLIDGVISKDMEMMVVLTTNFIENIDQSLLRPGRFDAVISIQAPDQEAVGRLIHAYARGLISPDIDLTRTADLITGQVPATVREVVERAKLSMLMDGRDHLTEDDLYISAYGMKHHIDLLAPKSKAKTPRDLLFEGMLGVVAEAGGLEVGEGFDGVVNSISSNSAVHARNTQMMVKQAIDTAKAAAAKSQEVLEAVKTKAKTKA